MLVIFVCAAASAVLWWLLYTHISLKWKRTAEYNSHVVAGIHAVIVTALAYACLIQGPNPLTNPGEPNTGRQDVTMVLSLGYFIYDFCWCIYHKTEPPIMIVHHILSIVSIGLILFKRVSGAEAVAGIGSMECTNPLLQSRWFLRTHGYNRTLIHTCVEISFILCFVIMRLGYGTALTYFVVSSNNVQIDVKICTFLLYIISLIFIYLMGQFIVRKYYSKNSQTSEMSDEVEYQTG